MTSKPASARDYHALHPVSVRLDKTARGKLAAIAAVKGTSVHAEILAAVGRHIEENAEVAA